MSEKASSSSLLEAIKLKLGKLPKPTEDPEKKLKQNYFGENLKDLPESNDNSEKTELFEDLKNIENIENSSENNTQEDQSELLKDLDDESLNIKNISQKITNKTNLKEINSLQIDEENSEEDIEEIKPQEQNPKKDTSKPDPIELELQKLEAELEQKKQITKPEIKIENLDLTDEKPLVNETKTDDFSLSIEEDYSQITSFKSIDKTQEISDLNDDIKSAKNQSKKINPIDNLIGKTQQNNISPHNNQEIIENTEKSKDYLEDNFHELRSRISENSTFKFSPTLKYLEEINQKTAEILPPAESEISNQEINETSQSFATLNENLTTLTEDPKIEDDETLKTNNNIANETEKSPDFIASIDIEQKIKSTDKLLNNKNIDYNQQKLKELADLSSNNNTNEEENEEDFQIQNFENELIKNSMQAIKEELTSIKKNTKIHEEDLDNYRHQIHTTDNFEENIETNSKLEKISHSLIHEETIYQSTSSIKKLIEAKDTVKKINESFGNNELLNKIAINLMEPKLEKWLNENLPNLVEEIVRKEIEKIIPK